MKQIGAKLRAVRMKWGLTLREVEERSLRIAQERENPSCRISASWLNRVELDGRGLSVIKLIVLAAIYSISPEQLLAYCSSAAKNSLERNCPLGPNTTLLRKRPVWTY